MKLKKPISLLLALSLTFSTFTSTFASGDTAPSSESTSTTVSEQDTDSVEEQDVQNVASDKSKSVDNSTTSTDSEEVEETVDETSEETVDETSDGTVLEETFDDALPTNEDEFFERETSELQDTDEVLDEPSNESALEPALPSDGARKVESGGNIRVLLKEYQENKDSVSFGNQDVLAGYNITSNKSTGALLKYTNGNYFTLKPERRIYARETKNYTTYDKAVAAKNAYSGKTCTVGVDSSNNYFVMFGPYTSSNYKTEQSKLTSAGINTRIVNNTSATNNFVYVTTKTSTTPVLVFADENNKYPYFNTNDSTMIRLRASSTSTSTRSYRGYVTPTRTSSYAKLSMSNLVNFEQYLYSVTPSEMPSSWNLEALKAQAIAARTYAYTRNAHGSLGSVCDTVHCQAYVGATHEYTNSTNAVKGTTGLVAYYGSTPINAYFSSSTGGATANSEDVWSATVPYIRATDDSKYDPNHTYTRTYTLKELENYLRNYKNTDVGTLKSVKVTKTDEYGRAMELVFDGTKADYVSKKDNIRSVFNKTSQGSLRSNMFSLNNSTGTSNQTTTNYSKVSVLQANGKTSTVTLNGNVYGIDSTSKSQKAISKVLQALGINSSKNFTETTTTTSSSGGSSSSGDTVVIKGSGYGHGLGMSQYGANAMAKSGKKYDEILKFYYKGITIKKY